MVTTQERRTPQAIARRLLATTPPAALRANFRQDEARVFPALGDFIERTLFAQNEPAPADSAQSKQKLEFRLQRRRITKARDTVVPWLAANMDLSGARILEIGCGSGSNAVAYAEQGATVTGIDVDPLALAVATERVRLYGLDATFIEGNADAAANLVDLTSFDLIMFYASLDHMTDDERRAAMGDTWRALRPGCLWGLVETPNRLWFRDGHTSWLPFLNWLPDDLAMPYLAHSPKPALRELATLDPKENMLALRRRGRALSFHEFELYMHSVADLDVVSCLSAFRRRNPALALRWYLSDDSRYERLLARQAPKLHRGFLQRNLDLLIRKGGQ